MLRSALGLRQFRQEGCLSYLLFDRRSREALVIDPRPDLMDDYRSVIAEQGLKLVSAIDLRLHIDHPSATHQLRSEYGCEIMMSSRSETARATRKLSAGDGFRLGDLQIDILDTPGCSSDAISLNVDGLVFTGDALWIGGSSRCDLPGASAREFWLSLHRVLGGLPDETLVLPGHDRRDLVFSTIAVEKGSNPAFLAPDADVFSAMKQEERHPVLDDFDRARIHFNLEASPAPDARISTFGGSPFGTAPIDGAQGSYANINVEKLRKKLEDHETGYLFVDVREEKEFGEGHIPGMRNLPLSELGLHLAELKKAKRIYVSCLSGRRSLAAAKTLAHVGFRDVVLVAGGLNAWIQAGFSVE